MADSIKYLVAQFNLQTKLFNNVTIGVEGKHAQYQMNDSSNHIAWLVGHLVSTRFMLAKVLGLPSEEPFPEFFGNGKGIDTNIIYPTIKELTENWNVVSDSIANALIGLNEEAIKQKMPRPVPLGDTLGDFMAFLMHHEAYTIGQVGLLRRAVGLPAMKYN